MSPRARRLFTSAGVFALGSGFTAWLAAEAEIKRPELPEHSALAALASPVATVPIPISKFAAVAERPLFMPSRRPPPPTPAAAPAAEPKPPPPPTLTAALEGILISPEGRLALVRWPDGKRATMAEGTTVDGWLLKQVMPDRAMFVSGSISAEIEFPAAQVVRTAAAAARPAVPVRRR